MELSVDSSRLRSIQITPIVFIFRAEYEENPSQLLFHFYFSFLVSNNIYIYFFGLISKIFL